MGRHFVFISQGLGLLFLAASFLSPASGGDNEPSAWSREDAAKYLDERAQWWLDWSGSARGQGTACISCHTTLPFALARPTLRKVGEAAKADTAEGKLIANLIRRVENWDTIAADSPAGKDPFVPYYANKKKQQSLGTEAVLNALVLVNLDTRNASGGLSAPARKALDHLWGQQQENGAWLWLDFGLNPWEKNGEYYGASLAAVTVGMAGKDYYEQADVRGKVAALKKFLATEHANQPLHHRAVGLWGASYLPGTLAEDYKKKLVEELFALQEADGGWSLSKLGKKVSTAGDWETRGIAPPGAVSDGYATGLVVLVLKRTGIGPDDPKLRKGINWLIATQKDGIWPLSYLNKKRDPQENIGKFMRDAATAFAVLALTESGKK